MGIDNPQTYGEYFWKMNVEASAAFDERLEENLSPYFRGLIADSPEIELLPVGVQSFLQAMSDPPTAGFGDLIKLTGGEFGAEILKDLIKPAMKMMDRANNRRTKETWLTSQQANTLFRQGKIDLEYWKLLTESEGYENIIGRQLYESEVAYPSIPDLVLYSRYHGDPKNVWSEIQKWYDVPIRDFPVWEWLGLQRLTTLEIQNLYKRGDINQGDFFDRLSRIGWDDYDKPMIQNLGYSIPNSMLLVQGDLQQGRDNENILRDISIGDIHPDYADKYLDAILTKPSSIDLINYHLRKDPTLTDLSPALRKIGIHPDYFEVYKTLAHPIPPVADIITMAVREAFSPEIAGRFGQYDDYPAEFEEWAAKKGLSKDWSRRYWASHWSLPSAQQGFEMLHRSIINEGELNLLLRALDVMPFWREKLTQMAYRRLTRVDIRRMYSVGVLNEGEVFEAYSEQGYNERDAKRMSQFTVRQTLATQSKFTARDIIAAYAKYMINRGEAVSLLGAVGVRSENISFIISSADYKREWELTDSKISAIRNLYKKAVYDDDKARGELLRLNLPSARVDVLMEQWYIDEKDKPVRRWTTAQTLGFIEKGIITPERGKRELQLIGYDAEHINVYMKASE